MARRWAIVSFLLLAGCRGEAQPVTTIPSAPAHYEIRADRLPEPYASHSSANPPHISSVPAGIALHLPSRFHIARFASHFDDPRNLILAPNGDIILAETGPGRVSILRDANHDGIAESRFEFARTNAPFGLALHGSWLYVGTTEAVVRFPYRPGDTKASGPAQTILTLPDGGHTTRNVTFSADGTKLYVAVGSATNDSPGPATRAAVMESDADGQHTRVYASGLRNPVGLAWNSTTGALWTAVNERDGLGDELVPDFITDLHAGAFFGWPYAYIGQHSDPTHTGERRDLVARSIVPSVLIQAHSAPLNLVFYEGTMFPAAYRGAAFVALHGSWNRSRLTGYKVISVPFKGGHPAGGYDDFVTGWAPDPGARSVWGRPVGLLVLADGSLLIADDGGNVIWRVTYQ